MGISNICISRLSNSFVIQLVLVLDPGPYTASVYCLQVRPLNRYLRFISLSDGKLRSPHRTHGTVYNIRHARSRILKH